jgi:proteasome lid subunit RPN8/RPN11
VLDSIAEQARREAPNECCGLLIGSIGRIDRAVPLRNRATDPQRRYEIDPRDFLAAVKQCRGTPDAVLGAYHSHPRGTTEPSESDRAEAFGDFLYVIAGPVAEDVTLRIEAFRLEDGNFRRIRLVPDPKEPEP